METTAPPSRNEDHRILIDITIDQRTFSLPCKVYLPETILDQPQFYILPNRAQYDLLPQLKGSGSFRSTNNVDDQIYVTGENVHISGGNMISWGDGLEEGYLKIYPSRFTIQYKGNFSDKNIIWFQLTPSLHLSPFEIRDLHYDGTSKVSHCRTKSYLLNNYITVTFKNHYKWLDRQNNTKLNFPEIIGEAELTAPLKEDDIEQYIKLLDDFLLLVSFAEGQKIIIPRLQVFFPDKYIKIFRCDRSLPNISPNHSFHNLLIDQRDFDIFINKAWPIFKNHQYYSLLKSALETLTSDISYSMESRFLSLFSSIETLVLAFRLAFDQQHVLSDHKQWNLLKKCLMHSIKSQSVVELDKDRRKIFYINLNSINRIPLYQAFEKLLSKKQICSDDLWNFSNDENGYSLTTIRNRLVHGYGIGEKFIDSFSVALQNIKLYAKRLLLSEFNWDLENSKVFRRDENFIKHWELARERISEWK